jgi:hypothetical protein
MKVTTFNNQTYPTNTTAPEFSVTWEYPPGPATQPVHAFPNIKLESNVLPATLQTLGQVNFDVHWTYGLGNDAAAVTDVQALTGDLLNGNVAIDMFLDSDQTNAQNSTTAKYEVMVWFADFGSAAQPIGLDKGIVSTQVLNGTTLFVSDPSRIHLAVLTYPSSNLYAAQNGIGQNVMTWLASETTERFTNDIAPLLTQLTTMNSADFPAASDYLGYLSFGSEAFSSNSNVTFNVPLLSIDLHT